MKNLMIFIVMLISMTAWQTVVAQSVTVTPATADICTGSGSSVTLTALPTGPVVSNYQWLDNSSVTIFSGLSYAAISVSPTIVGTYTYTVIVSFFGGGTAIATATVTVNPTPIPGVSVDDASICEGDDATLTSTISGQWYKNGTIISGAIGTTYNTTTAGSYNVFVTVGGCSGESAGTVVTVNPLPDAGFTPNTLLDECSDGVTPFVANLTGPNYTYQWYRSVNEINASNPGTAIIGATSESYTPNLQNLLIEETYYYSLTITNTVTMCSSTW